MSPQPHNSLFLFLMFPLPRLSSPNYLPNSQSSLGRGIFEGTQFRISLFPISVLNKLKIEVKDEGFDSTWITLGAQIGGRGVSSVNTVGILIKNPRVGQPTNPLQQHWVGLSLA